MNFYLLKITNSNAIKAGNPCLKNILLLAVIAPKIPATITQSKKKIAILKDHSTFSTHKDHNKPAAKKPLYKPWLAAKALVGVNKSAVKDLNVAFPLVSQANISMYKIYKCSIATKAIKILLAIIITVYWFVFIFENKYNVYQIYQ